MVRNYLDIQITGRTSKEDIAHVLSKINKYDPLLKVEYHPWNGEPFSEHYELYKPHVIIHLSFGTGGYYLDAGLKEIKNFIESAN